MVSRFQFLLITSLMLALSGKLWGQPDTGDGDSLWLTLPEQVRKEVSITGRYVPKPRYDHTPEVSHELLKERLLCMNTSVPVTYHNRVKVFVDYFSVSNRPYSKEMVKRSAQFFPLFEKILAEEGLPDELKYLAIVESGLNPRARSRAAAVGLWQFISSTGRSMGLHQDFYLDERMDPQASTIAACKYLKQLYGMFDDWELALAAYNCGPGNVRKAIRRSGYAKNFYDIFPYLPRETRSYVPQFVAIAYLFNHLPEHNLVPNWGDLKVQAAHQPFKIEGFTNLEVLAKSLGLCYDELTTLNPSVRRFAVPASMKGHTLYLPSHVFDSFLSRKDSLLVLAGEGESKLKHQARYTPGSTYGRKAITYRVKQGDVLGSIAQRYGVRVSDIKSWNGLRGNLIRVNQKLIIWVKPATASNKPKVNSTVSIDGLKHHRVIDGDSLWSISQQYEGLTVAKLKQLNALTSNVIKPGQLLRVQ